MALQYFFNQNKQTYIDQVMAFKISAL